MHSLKVVAHTLQKTRLFLSSLTRSIPAGRWRRQALRTLEAWLAREEPRLVLWVPVLMGFGSAAYFFLGREPSPALAPLGLVAGTLLFLWGSRQPSILPGLMAAALLLLSLGFGAAQLRTASLQAPTITQTQPPQTLIGQVVSVSPRGERMQLIVKPLFLSGWADKEGAALDPSWQTLPRRLDLRASPKQLVAPLGPGAVIRARVVLMPLHRASEPTGFSPRRWGYFRSVGGRGFVTSDVSLRPADERVRTSLTARVDALRYAMTKRIEAQLDGAEGAVAKALLLGERSGISPEIREPMTRAGLAHILAISGLHMSLFGGTLFLVFRWIGALSPRLERGISVKKTAAILGLAGSFAYLVFSGASVSAQRALIMLALIFIAILLNRRALSLRLVAAAGTIILLLKPESVIEPGFQLSFAAVIALIAVVEWRQAHRLYGEGGAPQGLSGSRPLPAVQRGLYRFAGVIGALALTSLVAGLATGPLAAYHFNQTAPYGLLGNVLAMPIVTFFVMPAAVLTYLAWPFGLEGIGLALMELGITAVLSIAAWVADLPGSAVYLPARPLWTLPVLLASFLWLVIWRTRARYVGIPVLLIALALPLTHNRPALLISADGRSIGLMGEDHRRLVFTSGRSDFTLRVWQERDGRNGIPLSREQETEAWRCDAKACRLRTPDFPLPVLVVLEREAFLQDCGRTALIISHLEAPRACAGPRLFDKRRLSREGGQSLSVSRRDRLVITSTASLVGSRPWSP